MTKMVSHNANSSDLLTGAMSRQKYDSRYFSRDCLGQQHSDGVRCWNENALYMLSLAIYLSERLFFLVMRWKRYQ